MSTRLITIIVLLGVVVLGELGWMTTTRQGEKTALMPARIASGSDSALSTAPLRPNQQAPADFADPQGARSAIPPGHAFIDPNVQPAAADAAAQPSVPAASRPAASPEVSLQLVQAQPAKVGDAEKKPDRIQFVFRAAPWEKVLTEFATDAKLALQMDVVPEGTFNFIDESNYYTTTEALDVLNGYLIQKGYLLLRRDRFLVVIAIRPNQPIPLQLVPPVNIEDLGKYGRNEFLSIVIPVVNIDTATAANEVRQLLSPIGRVSTFGQDRLVIFDIGQNLRRIHELLHLNEVELSRRPYAVFRLKHTTAEEVARALTNYIASARGGGATSGGTPFVPSGPGVSPSGPGVAPISSSSASFAGGNAAGPFEPTVVAQKETNCLLVSSPPKYLKMIEDLIQRLDAPPPQVLIQAMLVEVELANTDEFGVEIGVQDPVLFDRSIVDNILTVTKTLSDPGTGIQTTDQTIISQSGTPGFPFNNRPLGNNIAINPSHVGAQGLSSFALGRTNGALGFGGLVLSASANNVNVLLRALAARRKVNVLSRPQIRALNNQEAKIQVGQKVPVVNGVNISQVGTANPQIIQDDAGIILKVTPKIGPCGEVTIAVVAEKSQFRTGAGNGVPIFVDATNGNVIEAPIKDLTTAQTSVSVETGQTIVLGGIITKDSVSVENKVPWLGDLPYVGVLFRHNLDTMQRRELLIFLTPHVIVNDDHSDTIRDVETQRTHFPYSDAERIHGPIAEHPHHYVTPEGRIISEPAMSPVGPTEFGERAPAVEEIPPPTQGWGRPLPSALPPPKPRETTPPRLPSSPAPLPRAAAPTKARRLPPPPNPQPTPQQEIMGIQLTNPNVTATVRSGGYTLTQHDRNVQQSTLAPVAKPSTVGPVGPLPQPSFTQPPPLPQRSPVSSQSSQPPLPQLSPPARPSAGELQTTRKSWDVGGNRQATHVEGNGANSNPSLIREQDKLIPPPAPSGPPVAPGSLPNL